MFKIGDRVVCAGNFSCGPNSLAPKKGEIYTIQDFRFGIGKRNGPGIYLVLVEVYEVAPTGRPYAYVSTKFRPVTYISDSQFEQLEKELNKEEYAKI